MKCLCCKKNVLNTIAGYIIEEPSIIEMEYKDGEEKQYREGLWVCFPCQVKGLVNSKDDISR